MPGDLHPCLVLLDPDAKLFAGESNASGASCVRGCGDYVENSLLASMERFFEERYFTVSNLPYCRNCPATAASPTTTIDHWSTA
ncbi:MAG: hypothetical protein OMOMHJEC_01040 [Xanthomonadales bacterium]|nr:hypothetical protein [Xanthomonadales bacterium]